MLVYEIENLRTGELYYGSTTRPLMTRIKEHFRHACHRDTPLYVDMRSLGQEAFSWRVVKGFNSIEAASKFERMMIEKEREKTYRYNLHIQGNSVKPASHRANIALARLGQKLSEDTKRKISEKKKGQPSPKIGRVVSGEALTNMRNASLKRSKPFRCNESGEIFQSLSLACKKRGIDKSSLGKVLLGKRDTVGGHSYSYIEKDNDYAN